MRFLPGKMTSAVFALAIFLFRPKAEQGIRRRAPPPKAFNDPADGSQPAPCVPGQPRNKTFTKTLALSACPQFL
jgi:hypothetical protein